MKSWMNPTLLFLLAYLGTMNGCLTGGGTEIPNELTGQVFREDQGLVGEAEIRLIPVDYQPGNAFGTTLTNSPLYTTKARSDGKYFLKQVPAGTYNILASKDGLASFRDSIAVTGKSQSLESDTLRITSTLVGKIELEPQHDPRLAQVQVLGTLHFVNVDENGWFTIPSLAAGSYRLAVTVSQPGYAPLYHAFTLGLSKIDTLPDALRPFYADIPVVTSLSAMPGSGGTVKLHWPATDYRYFDSYLIFKDSADALVPSDKPIARTQDTTFIDTLYSRNPREGQFAYLDTNYHYVTYRVIVLSTTQARGPFLKSTTVAANPPSLQHASGRWKKVMTQAPYPPAWVYGAAVFRDSLWLIGSDQNGGFVWNSADGMTWSKVDSGLPFGKNLFSGQEWNRPRWNSLYLLVFQNKLWIQASIASVKPGDAGGIKNTLWSSPDGHEWTLTVDSLAISPHRMDFEMLVHDEKLCLVNGQPWYLGTQQSAVLCSEDGLVWMPVSEALSFAHGAGEVISFQSRLWSLGNPGDLETRAGAYLFSSPEGRTWQQEGARLPFSQLYEPTLIAHHDTLYLIGGLPADATDLSPSAEIWKSPDGKSWSYLDARAPFGGRMRQVAVSFQGRLWLLGGITAGGGYVTDIWYLE